MYLLKDVQYRGLVLEPAARVKAGAEPLTCSPAGCALWSHPAALARRIPDIVSSTTDKGRLSTFQQKLGAAGV